MLTRRLHVTTSLRGGWTVRTAGAARALKRFDKQTEAVKYARKVAKERHGELVIHREDGTIRSYSSYKESLQK